VLKNHDRTAGIVIFAVSALLFYNTHDYPPETAEFPRIILSIMLILSGWMILRSFVLADWRSKTYEEFFIHGGRFVLAVSMMAVYILGINYLGYYTTTLAYIPLMAWLLGFRNRLMIVLSTILYLALILVVFDILFERQLPKEFFMP